MGPNKFRDRKYCAVLYPEDPTHAACVDKLKSGGYNYACILHDKDVHTSGENEGELKKAHWHVVIKFPNAVWNEPLAKELGIQTNYLEKVLNLDAALTYLVHDGYEDKYQYDISDVFGPLQTRLASLLKDTDESTRALNIYDIIRSSPGIVTYTEVFEKACKAGLYGDFRRMGSGVMYLIKDHNQEFYELSQRNAGVSDSRQRFNDYLYWTGSRTDNVQNIDGLAPFK